MKLFSLFATFVSMSISSAAQVLHFRDAGHGHGHAHGMSVNHAHNFFHKRVVDPAADPTRASVLSVLATAIPSDVLSSLSAHPDPTLAPGANPPEWFEKLPADVKSLLPELFPEEDVHANPPSESNPPTSVAPTSASTSSVATPPGPKPPVSSTGTAPSNTADPTYTISPSAPPFPTYNSTVPHHHPTSGTGASQTTGAPPIWNSNAAVAGAVDVAKVMGFGVLGIMFGVVV
ncbi:hypothetical protein P280DRAFT_156388 [Massarina eburnea CBS 473.64]|uniref:Uncharacterized protein n=1 Tax=Massarina eburnea CBS 473.64 TaxID=1395130 RepID=A0A6A6RPH7_9PLEO|nr:hypothetical protein P280DRAFT_156388 [Massarina eburnea CBS 473.64]